MNYTTSRDYEALWERVKEGKEIVCMDGDGYLGRAHITEDGETRIRERDGSRLISDTESKLEFIRRCRRNEIKFFPPDAWIKIESDKDLPIEGKKYLLRCKYGTETGIFNNGVFRSQITDVTLSGITHWMPLPEAPKE